MRMSLFLRRNMTLMRGVMYSGSRLFVMMTCSGFEQLHCDHIKMVELCLCVNRRV